MLSLMKKGRVFIQYFSSMLIIILAAGCMSGKPTTTSTPSTPTAIQPSISLSNTDTPIYQPAASSTAQPSASIPSPSPTPEPIHTSFPPLSGSGGGVIAFVSEQNSIPGIYAMNADGSDQRLLTGNYDSQPDWSPAGSQLVFMSLRPGNRGIYTMEYNGSNQRRLTDTDRSTSDPAWSPDGSKIAFIFDLKSPYELFLMDINFILADFKIHGYKLNIPVR